MTPCQRSAKWAATSATTGPWTTAATSCQPTSARGAWRCESRRSPAIAVRSMPPTNATRPSMTIVFSWWQCSGRSCRSRTQRIGPARRSSSATRLTVRRDGRNTGTGAPAQSRTRTSTRRASSASRLRRTTGSRPSCRTKSGDMNHPLRCTYARAARISSTMRPSASSPSTSTSRRLPARAGGASSANPPAGLSSACLPSFASRRRWWARTAAATVSPMRRSSPCAASRARVTRIPRRSRRRMPSPRAASRARRSRAGAGPGR